MKHFVNSHHVHVLQVRGHTVHISVPSEWVGGRFREIEVKPIPLKYISHQYLTNVQSWNIRFGGQTIHPTQKFTSMNLLQMPCVIRNMGMIIFDLQGCGGC